MSPQMGTGSYAISNDTSLAEAVLHGWSTTTMTADSFYHMISMSGGAGNITTSRMIAVGY